MATLGAKMDAQTRLIEAVRATQVEQGRDIAEIKVSVAQIPEIKAGLSQIVSMLERLSGDS